MRSGKSLSARTSHLVAALTRLFSRYIEFDSDAPVLALALWVLHTWTFDAAEVTPYIFVTGPERRTGKSRLLFLCRLVVAAPLKAEGITPAALFRAVEGRTLLLDEIDAIFNGKSDQEHLRGVINAGYERGATVLRCVGEGSRQRVAEFPVFSPKALAGIDNRRFPQTIADRSITIRLQRRMSGSGPRLRKRHAEAKTAPLRDEIAEWAEAAIELLRDSDPLLPDALNDRAQDIWESLVAIADLAGGAIGTRARLAAVELSGHSEVEDDSLGVRCLADIRAVFEARPVEATFTRDLIAALLAIDDAPWASLRDGRGLGSHLLSELLRPFGIRSRSVRIGEATAKGYKREQFEQAWRRYLPAPTDDPSHRHNPLAAPDCLPVAAPEAPRRNGSESPGAGRSAGVTVVSLGKGAATHDPDAEIERLRGKWVDFEETFGA